MVESLRMRVVEAGARALHENRPESQHWLNPVAFEGLAEAALDAILDALAENADEWMGFAGTEQTEPIRRHVATHLLAALRPDRSP